jgi:hypothetical protein
MLYREIMAVCSEIHTQHINTVCGWNAVLLNVKLVVYIVTTELLNGYLEVSCSNLGLLTRYLDSINHAGCNFLQTPTQ